MALDMMKLKSEIAGGVAAGLSSRWDRHNIVVSLNFISSSAKSVCIHQHSWEILYWGFDDNYLYDCFQFLIEISEVLSCCGTSDSWRFAGLIVLPEARLSELDLGRNSNSFNFSFVLHFFWSSMNFSFSSLKFVAGLLRILSISF